MGFFSNLFRRGSEEPEQPQLTIEELIEKLNYCKEHDLPVQHRIHGDLGSGEDINTIENRAHALNK